MNDLWHRFENWLEQNIPDALQTLNPGASSEEIEAIQNILGIKLPEDYIASCMIHNGQNQELPSLTRWGTLLSLGVVKDSSFNTVRVEWEMLKSVYEEDWINEPEGNRQNNLVKGFWWIPQWVPIISDGSGNGLCLDLDPEGNGTRGQVIEFIHDSESREVIAPSFRALFEQLVNGVEEGSIVYNEEWGLISRDELGDL
ncbi:SMI1/KNR4 family protein [Nodosilinea sp. FACHB-131]|uniref:SMI1/KNR4 family protein n=1 Tax=Cyanophyceae TaxID=3028117 RepID=UPI0016835460|nr:SMI1/KNR4 family protein [Nodosilinea sp. FACHB-131]MBD1875506.1 SMI1/KNR4 family protein [Nodosilinea sp. FACHB-131]